MSITFQPCISWGGKCFWNGSNKWFCPNFRSENNNFGGHFSWSPDFGGLCDSKTWNFVIFDIIPKKYRLKRAKWAMFSYGGVKNHRTFFLRTDTRKPKKMLFCISFNYSTFWCRRPYIQRWIFLVILECALPDYFFFLCRNIQIRVFHAKIFNLGCFVQKYRSGTITRYTVMCGWLIGLYKM